MSELNTELMSALLKKESIDEVFRSHLEDAINDLLKIELTEFLGYEKHSVDGYGTGNSRNGFYTRVLDTKYGKLHLNIPRDRNGSFDQQLIPDYSRRTDDLETTIITLYRKGITTREISDLIEKLYGHYYSASTVSNFQGSSGSGQRFPLQASFGKICSHLYGCHISERPQRQVAKEPLHVLLGITPDGTREIIDCALSDGIRR